MRTIRNINDGWKFIKADVGAEKAAGMVGENINLPHSWNGGGGGGGGGY